MADFPKLKKQLNPEQLQAVETIEGPVMVLAGPGTGKTQVVAMRIAEILARTQVSPRNILALTFTEAGVTALRQRLESIIGAEAYQVTIATFHSFSNEIIGTFPYLFNLDENASRLTDLDRYLLLEDIVLSMPHLSLLRPLKVPTAHISAIGNAIRTAKQENVSPEKLRELAENDLEEARTYKTKLERDRAAANANKNIELAEIYQRYEDELNAQSQYDYEDMILRVVSALKIDQELRLHYQERYQYILVDEYQDTNNSQNALVETLADFFTNPNLFVVGDDKQAIYRFQGASVANMLHFTRKYPAIKIISLKNNYRSTPEILEAASALINHNRHQLATFISRSGSGVSVNGQHIKDVDPTLTPVKKSGPAPLLVKLPTTHSQYDYTIEEIKKLQKAGHQLSEIAVLFRLNAQVRAFRQLAEKHGLLVGGTLQSNLITEPEVQLLITILRAVANPLAEQHLVPALRALTAGPDLIELLEVLLPTERAKQSLVRRLAASDRPALSLAANTILELHQVADKTSLVELFEQIIESSTMLEATRRRPSRIEGLELISAFLDEARRFSLRRPTAKLKDFLSYLDLLKKYNVQLTVNRILPERNGLFISTIHGAKGLEFETVMMPDVDEVCWNVRSSRSVITLPSTIVELKNWNDDVAEDDRRIFYVGLTRAKNRLYLIHSTTDDEGREILPCQFVAELSPTLTSQVISPPPKQIELLYEKHFQPLSERVIAKRDLEFIREKISSQPFSYTDLATFQLCPKQYLLARVFRLPSEPSIPLTYGNAVHRALELFSRSYRATKKLPTVAELLEFFDRALAEQPPTAHDDQIRGQGQKILASYYAKNATLWPLPEGVEYSFRNHHVMLGDIWLTGKYDRLDQLDPKTKAVRVVDYKTVSRAPSRNQIEGNTKNSDGHFKQQLTFYALLARADRLFPYRADEFTLSFIDDQQIFKEETFTIDKKETEALAEDIKKAHSEILTTKHFEHTRDEFDHGCEICAAFPQL